MGLVNCLATMEFTAVRRAGSLFESLGAIASDLFKKNDKYKLFAKKVWRLRWNVTSAAQDSPNSFQLTFFV